MNFRWKWPPLPVLRTQSAENCFGGTIKNTISCCRWRLFRCTAIDWFSGPRPLTNFQVHGLLYRGYEYMAITVGQLPAGCIGHLAQLCIVLRRWWMFKKFVAFSRCNWCLMHKPTWIIWWTVNYCFRKLIINGGRQGRVPEPTQRAEIRHSAVTDSRHQITALDDRCKVR